MAGKSTKGALGLDIVQAVHEYGVALRSREAANEALTEAAKLMIRTKVETAQKAMRAARLQVDTTRIALEALLLDG